MAKIAGTKQKTTVIPPVTLGRVYPLLTIVDNSYSQGGEMVGTGSSGTPDDSPHSLPSPHSRYPGIRYRTISLKIPYSAQILIPVAAQKDILNLLSKKRIELLNLRILLAVLTKRSPHPLSMSIAETYGVGWSDWGVNYEYRKLLGLPN